MAENNGPDARRDRSTPLTILAELTYPEYRSRHLFTARFRLLIFMGFWFMYVLGFGAHATHSLTIIIVVLLSFGATCVSYYNIITDRFLIPSFILEIIADLVGLTVVVYVTGGVDSEYYFVYVLYSLLGGLFYNHNVASLTALASFVTYCLFLWAMVTGLIHPMEPIPNGAALLTEMRHIYHPHPAWAHTEWGHPPLLAALLFMAVYAVKIAHNFTQHRERVLEARNRELQALHQIGGTVRGVAPLQDVVDQVLGGIEGGLSFVLCLLMLHDRENNRVVCYPPRNNRGVRRAEEILGLSLKEVFLPIEEPAPFIVRELAAKKVIFRRSLADLMAGVQPAIDPDKIMTAQAALNVRKAIAIPLVAEQEVLGAVIGLTEEAFVSERVIATLEAFANQGALVLQTTLLIEELKAKNRQLEEANRVKSEFLATMSHELRTPLTAIIGFSELLLEGVMGDLSDEQQESLREVLNNGANLLSLINNLLDLAKMEAGQFELNPEQFDLRQLFDRTTRSLGSLITRKSLKFVSSYSDEFPPIIADERRIQQVVLNLLGNAIKFTPEGGEIRLNARYEGSLDGLPYGQWRENVKERTPFASGCFAIEVSDDGIGIPEGNLKSIFDKFKQVDSSVTRSYEGTGLGLALAKQLVELHHGVIWAESGKEAGARFICLIPTAPPPPPAVKVIQKGVLEPVRPAIHSIRVPV